ncbi:SRPBCC family protein [Yoonia sp.]|uniref:SRPBCC family protein n=1 Tax=Yoonia sp. TaxID=2212373 RepID=UPI002FDB408F
MKFSTREDIEAPIGFVFEKISDFDAYERRALRQGAEVSRRTEGPAAVGTTWDIGFSFRGRPRKVVAELTKLDPPSGLVITSASEGLDLVTEVDLIALSQSRTRVMVNVDLRAKTLTARLLLQSLKLAKSRTDKRFRARVLDYAEDIEDRFRREG